MIRIDLKGARLVGLFFLGFILLNYPLLGLFDTPTLIFGLPGFYVYLFTVWIALIILVGLVVRLSSVLKIRSGPSRPK